MTTYLSSTISTLLKYKIVAEKTFEQLSEVQLFWKPEPESNSIGIIVNHMAGNMLSRWTNFLTEDGEKSWRNRENEFEDEIASREMLLQRWNEGWKCFLDTLDSLNEDDLGHIVHIRNEAHTVMEAIQRQLAHYSLHVGQIIFLGKMQKGHDWSSLSIPKGESEQFNREMFGK
ncbi:DUF1572 domain-containing protein [Marinoscillum pacificum]|uniref:DUF1572 domain-containing protein n=1 Tax=Marinoscillum pacificum TaxID=392723 RepID=UPI0021571825|nr:DUF1572 domain-containing protein [Marinoscillum pacificum]